eukprot:300584-Prorocentrum_lima.AAC.1
MSSAFTSAERNLASRPLRFLPLRNLRRCCRQFQSCGRLLSTCVIGCVAGCVRPSNAGPSGRALCSGS